MLSKSVLQVCISCERVIMEFDIFNGTNWNQSRIQEWSNQAFLKTLQFPLYVQRNRVDSKLQFARLKSALCHAIALNRVAYGWNVCLILFLTGPHCTDVTLVWRLTLVDKSRLNLLQDSETLIWETLRLEMLCRAQWRRLLILPWITEIAYIHWSSHSSSAERTLLFDLCESDFDDYTCSWSLN